jgi:hypothetical protein
MCRRISIAAIELQTLQVLAGSAVLLSLEPLTHQ